MKYPEPTLGTSDIRDIQKEGDQSRLDGDPREAQNVDRDERPDRGKDEQPVLGGPEPMGGVMSVDYPQHKAYCRQLEKLRCSARHYCVMIGLGRF